MTTSKSCLLLHGFTGGPEEVEPLAVYLRSLGWHTEQPVLPGHDGPLCKLEGVRYEAWLQAAYEAAVRMRSSSETFVVAGFSMGGMLAAYTAARVPVDKLVLLNAALIYVSPMRFIRALTGKLLHKREEMAPFGKMGQVPLSAVREFMRLVRYCKPMLGEVRAPALIIQGEQDPIVHPLSARYLARKLPGAVGLERFPRSRHMICWDVEASEVMEKVGVFLEEGGCRC
ncbi:alpha/beta fold hydrolase [Xylanibacillus composti]|uniref:Carboxylesterase n=1 Tax=Xylanibacillus composti TaxID=1572762 RepID=A0A8J4H1Q6_9BACL|nr:alpha/beta fold hydrolase [Xylanibacillus composti]MDT9724288.1 alpha/beta fold hydrolase [Xylanibacillus composti]GIQ69284.1 carboxylesterase [Xylanibacillus composti]